MKAINWNRIEDPLDLEVWHRLTGNFWLPEKIPVSNDLPSWSTLSEEEKLLTRQVFAGLTMLDTLQCNEGAPSMLEDAVTMHEQAVLANASFMEAVHAKSYSTIFSTLCSTEEIDEIFEWVEHHPLLDKKRQWIELAYEERLRIQRVSMEDSSPEERDQFKKAVKKAASVLLESFLFYSGFYLPLHYASKAKLTNTADIIRLILRDEGVHGYYLGYKYQGHRQKLSPHIQEHLDNVVHQFALDLLEKEMLYTEELYDPVGWTENVKMFVRYNLNKAMNNLGYDSIIEPELTRVEPRILSAMAIDANETHDFFSGSGASYVIGTVEETTDEDWG